MAHIDEHPPGTFCWFELATSDQTAAKDFYTALFNWSVQDFPMGPDGVYSMFQLEGRDAAACYTLRDEQTSQGVPPNWLLYVAVESAGDAAAKVSAAGGSVLAPPFDVFDFGRMSVLQDPTGAVFAVWQSRNHKGTRIAGVPGTVCWADLSTPDQQRAAEFYGAVFGWVTTPGEDESGYLHLKNGDEFIGGIPPAHLRQPGVPPHWMLYFDVADCDASAAKATSMGANTFLPPTTMENVGRMAVMADPQGAVFALFRAMPRE